MNQESDSKDKIILPKNLQREMIEFFLRTAVPKIAVIDKEHPQTSPNPPDEAKE